MQRLWLQLTLGFALVALVSTLTVALLANAQAGTTFRGYLARSQALDSGLVENLAAHYAAQGSWAGADALLTMPHGMGMGMGRGRGQGQGQGAMMRSSLALADAAGQVVADPSGIIGEPALSRSQRSEALPIIVQGRTVGYLLARSAGSAALPAAAQRFLDELNSTLWVVGLLAGGLGLALGLLIARNLAAPLGWLATAARRIARGRLDERVPLDGPLELRTVATAFNEMAAALEAGETQRRHMVADIAHELRTPLTVIQGNLRAILDDVYPLSKTEVATIYEATLGLRRLVDDLRELSLAEAGRLALHPHPLELVPLLEHEVALFADSAAVRGVTLRIEAPTDLPPVLADPERLAQVLHNLVSNALRHTPGGGSVTLRAQLDDGRRTEDGRRLSTVNPPPSHPAPDSHGAALLIEVIDTGSGITPADLPHVFERFYRADRARARESGGSGLGLAIAHQLVRLQGGVMGVESAPGQGSCFWFSLPAL